MANATYDNPRDELRTYFDRTAVEAWRRLTSDEPVGRIRATVRAGREEMRANAALLVAGGSPRGCASSTPAAAPARSPSSSRERGARRRRDRHFADPGRARQERSRREPFAANIDWRVGDMLDPALGAFDYVVAMDSLIHYDGARHRAGAGERSPRAPPRPIALHHRAAHARC